MPNHLSALLSHWYPKRDELDWVLGTVINTHGSSYRKTGAMMLINSLGQYFGLLSGGCLESDILRQARKCWLSGENVRVTYDMQDEDDLAWQLGIGCGGRVEVLLQPVHQDNAYLYLDQVQARLAVRDAVHYQIAVNSMQPANSLLDNAPGNASSDKLVLTLQPPVRLAVMGGGVDAKPIVAMATELGWQVLLCDPRTGYARPEVFQQAWQIVQKPYAECTQEAWLQQIDAVMVMHHSLTLDGEALRLLQNSSVRWLGLLGPTHRTERVLQAANLTANDLCKPLSNPMGLDIGGELPESIALSALAEAHGVLMGKSAALLSHKFG